MKFAVNNTITATKAVEQSSETRKKVREQTWTRQGEKARFAMVGGAIPPRGCSAVQVIPSRLKNAA